MPGFTLNRHQYIVKEFGRTHGELGARLCVEIARRSYRKYAVFIYMSVV